MQRSFAVYDGFRKQHERTRRETFLAEMARVVPWRGDVPAHVETFLAALPPLSR